MSYNPGQVRNVFPFCKDPDWFILGGPADGTEAQEFVKEYPNCKVLACEPGVEMVKWQLTHDFPTPSRLMWCALSDNTGRADFVDNHDNPRCSSLMLDRPGNPCTVQTTTLDALHVTEGPFSRAVLWLDIEGWEYRALLGAGQILSQGLVDVVNVEILTRLEDNTRGIEGLMREHGFRMALKWNDQGTHHDRVYVKDTKAGMRRTTGGR